MLKITLLSISLLTVFGSAAIAPALAEIALAFPDVPATQIKALLTAPALTMLVLSPNIGWLAHRFGQKRLVLFGLVCYLLGGLAGGIAPTFETLFATRLLLGAGIGILMPMANGLIAEYYSGKERLQLMGWSSSATNFFGIASNLLVGFLALISWRLGMSIYGLAIVSLMLAIIYIPKPEAKADVAIKRPKLPRQTYLWALAMFTFMVAIYALPVNISLFITESELGGPREAGIAMSCLSASAIVAGLIGVKTRAIFGRFFVFVTLVSITFGYLLLVTQASMAAVVAALLIVGIGSGSLLPYIIFCATSSVKDASPVAAMGIVATAASLGQFATPVILDGVAFALGDTSTHNVFVIVCVGVAVFAAVTLLKNVFRRA